MGKGGNISELRLQVNSCPFSLPGHLLPVLDPRTLDWDKQGSTVPYPQEAAQSSWQEEVTQGPHSFQRRITTIQGPEPGALQEYEQVLVSTTEHVQRGPSETDSPKAGKEPSLWASESAFSQEVQVRATEGHLACSFICFALYLAWIYVSVCIRDVGAGMCATSCM